MTLILGAIWLVACSSFDGLNLQARATPITEPASHSPTPLPQVAAGLQRRFSLLQNPLDLPTKPPSPTLPPAPTLPPVKEVTAVPTRPSSFQHTIKRGETLLGLALHYGVSMASIQLANGMGNSLDLFAGHTLAIPGSTQWPDESLFWAVHVVQSGDTLVGLSAAYDLTVEDILRVNAIADADLIHPSQQLVMPLTQLATSKAPEPTPTSAPAAAVAVVGSDQAAPGAEAAVAMSDTRTTSAEPAPIPPPSLPAGPADWPAYLLTRINQARSAHGLNPLALAPELTYAAQAHAEDCARRGWGSHVGSDGAVLTVRLDRVGYAERNSGENWVQALNAARAFDWWFGEIPPNDPHRRNILSHRYTEVGIGIADTGWGYIFITDFGRR